MKVGRFVGSWALSFVLLFPANALAHVVVGGAWFDAALRDVQSAIPMKDGNPAPVAVLDLLIAGAIVAFLGERRGAGEGARVGALVNLVSSSAWNLANLATIRGWPAGMALADVAWHVTLGACVGAVVGWVGARRLATA